MNNQNPVNLNQPPSLTEVWCALQALQAADRLGGARLLLATAVGSWAEGCWEPGQDVDVRAVYVLPTRSYLSLGSFMDEIEIVEPQRGWDLDLVAFEVEKAVRLILKGHVPTLGWLCSTEQPPSLWCDPEAQVLRHVARCRAEQIESGRSDPEPILPQELHRSLDRLVIGARMGEVGR
ncbi:MAG: nucleotidyltransferase domain-containing protein [Bradymonadales bacterium]|nr:nucleotidyltransferase domain-containing protein [Bradymonadales bacterium]